MSIYDTLNKEQREACMHTEGPVLILAGAGSGKTRVITHRICYLIDEKGVNPYNILAITFTNKAAGEMRERVDNLVGFGAESIWISTFHSMCVRILRRHIDQIGYDNSFTIYDTDDSKSLMRGILKQLNFDPKALKERTVLSAISSAKNELQTPLQYREEHRFTFEEKQIADCYEEYQKQLHRNNALDFDDLLMKTVELFRSHDEILKNWQDHFRYIMVDEYQDTNTAQFELIRMLSSASRNLCVVGDDDQSIYKFRGANIRNILDFEQVYPDAYVVKLEQNYRSTQNVLDAANAVIKNNTNRKVKALWTDRGEGHRIRFRQFDTAQEEGEFITEDIAGCLRQDRKLKYGDFAVLYRTNAQARVLEECFVRDSIPYNVVGGTNFYSRKEIKDLLSYLKTIDNASDDLAVQRIINVPRRGIGATTVERIAGYAAEHDMNFFAALEDEAQLQTLGKASAKIRSFAGLIHDLRAYMENWKPGMHVDYDPDGIAAGSDTGDAGKGSSDDEDTRDLSEQNADPSAQGPLEALLKKVIMDTGYIAELKESDEEDVDDRIANIDELISKVVSYEESAEAEHPDEPPTLSGFLEDVALVADIDEVGEEDDRVLLMTLHSAKGLEFSHVYLAGMEDGIFPGQMTIASGDSEDMEEERRLAYVGITRAKDELTLTCARARMLRGETKYNPVSRFVYEIPDNLLDGRPKAIRRFGDDDDDGYEDDGPFADYGGRSGKYGSGYGERGGDYGSRGYGNRGDGGYGSRGYGDDGYGRGRTFVTYAGSSGSGRSAEKPYGIETRAADGRPKAVYVKPHTAEDKKPFIAKANSQYGTLSKGMPAAAGSIDYGTGDRVKHVKFGEGTVKEIEKTPRDYKVTVDFDDYGQKVMYAAFAKLEKI
jgi:DNA helicase-2/ATP-dependent DNA helicase PcrA